MLFHRIPHGVEHEAIHRAVLILDSNQLIFRIVTEDHACPRLHARGEAIHASIFQRDVELAVARTYDIPFGVERPLALVPVGLENPSDATQGIPLLRCGVAVRIDERNDAPKTVMPPLRPRPIGRLQCGHTLIRGASCHQLQDDCGR